MRVFQQLLLCASAQRQRRIQVRERPALVSEKGCIPPVRSDEHAGILSANMPLRILSMLLQAFSPFGTRMTPVYAGARKNGHDLLPHQHLQRALVLGCGVSPGAQDQVSLSLAESAKSSMLYLLPREPHLTSRRRASILA